MIFIKSDGVRTSWMEAFGVDDGADVVAVDDDDDDGR